MGFVKIDLFKSPLNKYFIFLEVLIWLGVTNGSYVQSPDKLVETQ